MWASSQWPWAHDSLRRIPISSSADSSIFVIECLCLWSYYHKDRHDLFLDTGEYQTLYIFVMARYIGPTFEQHWISVGNGSVLKVTLTTLRVEKQTDIPCHVRWTRDRMPVASRLKDDTWSWWSWWYSSVCRSCVICWNVLPPSMTHTPCSVL